MIYFSQAVMLIKLRRIIMKATKKIAALLLVMTLCFAMSSCSILNSMLGAAQPNTEDDGKPASAYVAIDINPSIELTISEDGTVVSVYGANEDGQVLLYEQEAEIIDKDIETAVAYITELAKEFGYLSEDNSDVSTTVSADTEEAAEALKNKIDAKIVSSAEGMGLAVTINTEAAFALLSELEELKASYPKNEYIQKLTPGKYKLVVSASTGGDVTIEAAAEMSNEELIKEINKVHKELKGHATEAYLSAKAKAKAMFESSMGIVSDGVYTIIYSERAVSIMAHPEYLNTIHYGATYQAYKTTARTYRSVLEIMRFANEYTNYELDETAVEEIKAALGITDDSMLRDKDGKITLGSVTKFCHRFIDKNEVSDEVKATVKEILAEAEDAAELVMMASETYKTELETLKNAIQTVVASVTETSSTILPMLPADAKAEFETCLADLNAAAVKLAEIMENGITTDEVIVLATEAEEKADAVLEKIQDDLTDEEKARVEFLTKGFDAQIKFLTGEFEGRLSKAEEEAKKHLEDKHNDRHGHK